MSTNRTESLAIAGRYATAMFDLAVEAKKEEVLVSEFNDLAAAVKGSAELATALSNPLLSRGAKADVLAALAKKGDKLTQQSLATLASGGRAEIIPVVAELLTHKLAAHRGAVEAQVTSARPLSKDMEKQIQAALEKATGKKVQLTLAQDPEVLGGVAIRVGSYLLDATLAGALNTIRGQLLATNS